MNHDLFPTTESNTSWSHTSGGYSVQKMKLNLVQTETLSDVYHRCSTWCSQFLSKDPFLLHGITCWCRPYQTLCPTDWWVWALQMCRDCCKRASSQRHAYPSTWYPAVVSRRGLGRSLGTKKENRHCYSLWIFSDLQLSKILTQKQCVSQHRKKTWRFFILRNYLFGFFKF